MYRVIGLRTQRTLREGRIELLGGVLYPDWFGEGEVNGARGCGEPGWRPAGLLLCVY